jgi:hypothetical protein
MGIFDPDEVITEHSLREAIEDGALVEIFKKRWRQLSGGKPIVASAHLVEEVGYARIGKYGKNLSAGKKR